MSRDYLVRLQEEAQDAAAIAGQRSLQAAEQRAEALEFGARAAQAEVRFLRAVVDEVMDAGGWEDRNLVELPEAVAELVRAHDTLGARELRLWDIIGRDRSVDHDLEAAVSRIMAELYKTRGEVVFLPPVSVFTARVE